MKPPWLGGAQDTAELEALQTDVMRFVAILGLCLAAIFSLVHSAAMEHTAEPLSTAAQSPRVAAQNTFLRDAVPAVSEHKPAVASVAKQTPTPLQAQVQKQLQAQAQAPTPAHTDPQSQAPDVEQTGFTLEFSSVDALQVLLHSGRVQLFARRKSGFWKMDANGVFARAVAPASYYDMHADTVPRHLRDALPLAEGDAAAAWGVTLPDKTVGQIQQLTASGKGGSLFIGREGSVSLEKPGPI